LTRSRVPRRPRQPLHRLRPLPPRPLVPLLKDVALPLVPLLPLALPGPPARDVVVPQGAGEVVVAAVSKRGLPWRVPCGMARGSPM
jgi:hypothetical protein